MPTSIDAPEMDRATDDPRTGADLAAAVTEKIHEVGGATVYDLRVLVDGGQVILEGKCGFHAAAQGAEQAARSIPGCGAVMNRIEVFDVQA